MEEIQRYSKRNSYLLWVVATLIIIPLTCDAASVATLFTSTEESTYTPETSTEYFTSLIPIEEATIDLTETSLIFKDSPNLKRLKEAKLLRNNLKEHNSYVEKYIRLIDEWAFKEIANLTQNDNFNEQLFKELENDVRNIKDNILHTAADFSLRISDIYDIKKKTESLNYNIDAVNIELNNKTRHGILLISEFTDNDNIVAIFDNFAKYKKILDEDVEQAILIKECIQEVRLGKNIKAVHKLKLIKNLKLVSDIVKEVYNGTSNNFNRVLQFGNSITNVNTSYLVYKALDNEMERLDDYNNADIIISFVESLNREILDDMNDLVTIKEDVSNLVRKLKDKLKSILKKELIALVDEPSYNYYYDDDRYQSIKKVFEIDEQLLSSVCTEVYFELNAYTHRSSVVQNFKSIFEHLIDIYENDNENTLKLLNFFHNLLYIDKGLETIFFDNYYIRINNQISETLRNVALSGEVCIKNFQTNEILYLSAEIYYGDADKYRVYTKSEKSSEELMVSKKWKFTRIHGNIYNIQNTFSKYSYLYAAIDRNNSGGYKTHGYDLYVWNRNDTLSHSVWEIVPHQGDIYIRHLMTGHNLYSSEQTDPIISRDINKYSLWMVELC